MCDIGMTAMDGYVLLQQIRALPEAQGGNTPAIAVTAFSGEEDRQRAFERSFQQHVAKPIELEQLLRASSAPLSSNPRAADSSFHLSPSDRL
jgi:CheY-like chemotaxis protein